MEHREIIDGVADLRLRRGPSEAFGLLGNEKQTDIIGYAASPALR